MATETTCGGNNTVIHRSWDFQFHVYVCLVNNNTKINEIYPDTLSPLTHLNFIYCKINTAIKIVPLSKKYQVNDFNDIQETKKEFFQTLIIESDAYSPIRAVIGSLKVLQSVTTSCSCIHLLRLLQEWNVLTSDIA